MSVCDVKAIQNTPKGVGDFWMRALLNHPIGSVISEKDRPILQYLQNIELELHDEKKGEGYDLKFTFDASQSYFEPSVLVKEIHMKNKGIVDKMVSTVIAWKDGCDPTKKKIKRKKKGKKINVEVKQESFFNFFKDEPEAKEDGKDDADKNPEEPDDELEDMIDEQQQMAEQMKDDLVPLALEYYLGVIEKDDDDSYGDMDDDEDEMPDEGKKKKKGKKGGAEVDPKDCKQQ